MSVSIRSMLTLSNIGKAVGYVFQYVDGVIFVCGQGGEWYGARIELWECCSYHIIHNAHHMHQKSNPNNFLIYHLTTNEPLLF